MLRQRLVNHHRHSGFVLLKIARQDVVRLLLGDLHAVLNRRRSSSRCVTIANGADVGRATVGRQLATFELLEKSGDTAWAHLHGETPSGG